ncbi:hypothetical protein [Escherichia coli]|uniref:hypothetical protein n=1 Tax=Escherichia coli TaxID=562 RepID=UPI000DA5AD84|nr:hypothetical protein [Escherichia coli]SQK58023.1 Uncharacterised protein [Escherichia coli]
MSSLITNTNISLHDLKVMWSSNRDVSLTETEDVRNIWLKIKDFFTQTNSNEIARLILINRHMMISSTGESNDTGSLNGTFSKLYRNVTSNLKDGINFHLETTNQDNTSMCYVSLSAPDGTKLGVALLEQEQAQKLERLDKFLEEAAYRDSTKTPNYSVKYKVMNAIIASVNNQTEGEAISSTMGEEEKLLCGITFDSEGLSLLASLGININIHDIMSKCENVPSNTNTAIPFAQAELDDGVFTFSYVNNEIELTCKTQDTVENKYILTTTQGRNLITALPPKSYRLPSHNEFQCVTYSPNESVMETEGGATGIAERVDSGIQYVQEHASSQQQDIDLQHYSPEEDLHRMLGDNGDGVKIQIDRYTLGKQSMDVLLNFLKTRPELECYQNGLPKKYLENLIEAEQKKIPSEVIERVFGTATGMATFRLISSQELIREGNMPSSSANKIYLPWKTKNNKEKDTRIYKIETNSQTQGFVGVSQKITALQLFNNAANDHPIVYNYTATISVPAGMNLGVEKLTEQIPTAAISSSVVII